MSRHWIMLSFYYCIYEHAPSSLYECSLGKVLKNERLSYMTEKKKMTASSIFPTRIEVKGFLLLLIENVIHIKRGKIK